MKILIIGAKGFIGSHAFHYFSKQKDIICWGCDVVVDYVEKQYIVLDATNSDFNEIFEETSFDFCINCSGAASVPDSLQHPLRDFTLNTLNVVKILEAIRKNAPNCRFINLSSAAVYGNPIHLPVSENDAVNPVSPYGRHKWYAEEVCKEYYVHFGIACASLRIFSAYGPGLKKQLLWDIVQKTKDSSGAINLFGTGEETRDFIYVEDIVSLIHIIMLKSEFTASVYNIANGQQIAIKDLAFMLLQNLDFQGKAVFSGDVRKGDPVNWQADISVIKDLGYVPKYTIEDGINNYVQWIKETELL